MSTKKRKYGLKSRFTMESLLEATERIKNKQLTTRQASIAYNIPRTTLVNKLCLKHTKSVGRPCILTDSEEESLVQNIFACIESGLQISPKDVRYMVKDYLDKSNKTISFIRNNTPSWEWSKTFLNRHKDLKNEISYERKRKMRSDFCYTLEKKLENVAPENIFNFIELKFCDDSKMNAIMYRKQDSFSNPIKSDFTVIFCANAIGDMTPPYIIYKGTLKCEEWLLGAPTGTQSSATTNGWIDEETFSDWFHTTALPVITTKNGNKILIGDKLSYYPSNSVLAEFQKHNIKTIQLSLNTTHILQPLEIKYVKTLRNCWWGILNAWKNTAKWKQSCSIPKTIFASLLNKTLRLGENTYRSKIITGFKESGIYPIYGGTVLEKTSCNGKFSSDNISAYEIKNHTEEDANLEEIQKVPLKKNSKIVISEANTSELEEICEYLKYDLTKINFIVENPLDKIKDNLLTENESDDEYIIEVRDKDSLENNLDSGIVLSKDNFCLINFECSLFPAKVINISEEYCDFIVLQKHFFGWTLPKSSNCMCRCKIEDIVKVLNHDQVVKKQYGFLIYDDDLQKEWGE